MTVVVVSWNTRELLIRCLDSLAPEVHRGTAQVWVVDNCSADGSARAAAEHAPWAHVVRAETNLGYGAAVNLVARQTDTPWLACANADIALQESALEAMLQAGVHARVGCVAPQLVLPDGRPQSSLHSLPTVWFALALNLGVHRLNPRLADRMLIPERYDLARPRDPGWAIGAFLLLRREAFVAVGGFDGRQWMYAEDLDLGWRLHQAGWITRYEPRARVWHESETATGQAFGEERVARWTRATYAVMLRRRGLARTWATAAINVLGAGVRVAWMLPLSRLLGRLRGPLAENRMWLAVHRQGLRSRVALDRGD